MIEFSTKQLRLLVESLDEWPSRPVEGNPTVKQRASAVFRNGDEIIPHFHDGDVSKLMGARLLGITEDEYNKAKEIIRRENATN